MARSGEGVFDLTGRLAPVTRGRCGIGLAMVEALTGAGTDIVVASAHLEESGSEAERRVTRLGRALKGHRVDFADRAAVAGFARRMGERARSSRPEEPAGVTVFLASAASAYVHGALIPVDGGRPGR